jgi:taurine dioxygenase
MREELARRRIIQMESLQTAPAQDAAFEVRPFDAALGAEVVCSDLRTISDDVFRRLHRAWLDHLVLLIRGQDFSQPHDLLAFGRRFGELERAPGVVKGQKPKDPALPDLAIVSNIKENGQSIGVLGDGEAVWHTDSSFYEVPPSASILYAVEIPPAGGNTSFANMYLAHDAMPESLRANVNGRTIKNDVVHNTGGQIREGYEEGGDIRFTPGPSHPIVRTHPETGYNTLYLGRRPYAYVNGLPVEESERLLDALWAHATQASFTWEHVWRVGDVIIWDNRCVLHRREAFDPASRRLMYRTYVRGSRPVELAEAATRAPHPRGRT